MTDTQSLLAFVVAASILTITPGVDTAMVLRSAAVGGVRPASFAALGIALGCLIWGAVVSLGLGVLLAASALAYGIVKWAGAAYLLWLGIGLLFRPRDGFSDKHGIQEQTDAWDALRRGFLTNLLNPKVGVFYISFLPQFVPAGADVPSYSFLLASIHVLLSVIWFTVLIAATVPIGRLLRTPRVVKVMDRVTGGVFVVFGLKLALSKQP